MRFIFNSTGLVLVYLLSVLSPISLLGQSATADTVSGPAVDAGARNLGMSPGYGLFIIIGLVVLALLVAVIYLSTRSKSLVAESQLPGNRESLFRKYVANMSSEQIERILKAKSPSNNISRGRSNQKIAMIAILLFLGSVFNGLPAHAQTTANGGGGLFSEAGILITITLILIPILLGIVLMIVKVSGLLKNHRLKKETEEAALFAEYLANLPEEEASEVLAKRKAALDFNLTHQELSGNRQPADTKGLLGNIETSGYISFVEKKKRAVKRPNIDPALSKMILWYVGSAAFWLLFGTTIGEYVGIKFVAPDIETVSWLSFGRLRPVHTNAVFWGWASLGMLGLGYYIVPMVSNTKLASIKRGWYSLWLINAAVIIGTLSLMEGINNGGGEYREYIWPIMLLFAIGIVLTLVNYLQTIAKRKTKEIYISNWYIVSAVMFAITITVVAYVPAWQDGLGETIIQGYYMHQGVGMWFMLFTLGIVYYMLPQQLNRPIYSYSLGVLAFWTQILFYTLIGTHHFVFSSIPWWLQTVAIVGSVGMVIPVVAGTTNFLMTFRGAWHKVSGSYTLPFFLVGIIFYFTGSLQGTAEAFRSTNLIWHFTDFTVAHSHLTMYGIICFFLWAGMYAVVPRLTGREAPQVTIGAHFWLALIGLLFYTIPLMIGSTLRGQMWIEGKPFMETVVHMAPYWLWRAIGGSLMWLSHIFFAYNLYRMIRRPASIDVKEEALKKFEKLIPAEASNN